MTHGGEVDGAAARPGRGSGAALGTQVLRYSSIHSVGLVGGSVLTFVSAIVVAWFLGPAEFGRLALLLFLTALLNLLFNLGSKQGTLQRVFGGADDEEDDDDADEEALAEAPERSLGTGLALTGLVSAVGTGLVVALAGPISSFLLDTAADRELIVLAALTGGFQAVLRLASLSVWMERRPYPYIALEVARPLLVLAVLVPLVATGAGLEGAIAGYAIGTGVTMVLALGMLRRSLVPCFEPREALAIMKKGARRIPIVLSMWTVGYLDIFLLSLFVSDTDLGIYSLASKAGFAVAFLPAGYRKALRPLRRTPTFAAVEEEYGVGVARGTQLGYFLLMLTGILLAITLFAQVLIRAAPESYADAAPLIPLLAAGLVSPTAFRMINKSAKFKDKFPVFLGGAVSAALLFIGFALLAIPELGNEGAPIAMIAGFAIPSAFILYRSQTGRTPVRLPIRSTALAVSLAAAIAAGYYLVDPGGVVAEAALAIAAWLAWAGLVFATGAIPAYHRQPLAQIARTLFGREPERFDAGEAVAHLGPRDRRALRMAIVGRRPLEEIAPRLGAGDPGALSARMVRALRRIAAEGGIGSAEPTAHDAEIGEYLFSRATVAGRDAIGKRLIKADGIASGDLRELEAVLDDLAALPRRAWRLGEGNGNGGTDRAGAPSP